MITARLPMARIPAISAERERRQKPELCFMLGSSPELNPDDILNEDTKQVMRRQRPWDLSQMMANARSHLHRHQKRPNIVRNFFQLCDTTPPNPGTYDACHFFSLTSSQEH